MSKEWYLLKSPYYTEGTEKDDFLFDLDIGFNDILQDSFQKDKVELCKGKFDGTNFEDEIVVNGFIESTEPDSANQSLVRQFVCKISTIKDYEYIKYDNAIWIIRTKPAHNEMYEKVVINLCNWVGKWQDKNLNVVLQPMFVLNASQYNNGVDGNKVLMIGSNQLMVYLPINNDTLYVKRDKRLFCDYNLVEPIPYIVTRTDSVSDSFGENRVVSWILTEDQYNPTTDNIKLMLCDYKSKPAQQDFKITYTGKPTIRTGGTWKTFTAQTTEICTWSTDIANENIVLSAENNICKIKCKYDEKLIDTQFNLICKVGDTESKVNITITGGV